MKFIEQVKYSFFLVYQKKQYYLYSILVAVLIFTLNTVAINYKLITMHPSTFGKLLLAGVQQHSLYSTISMIIISLLTGMLFVYTLYIIKRQIAASKSASIVGTLVGVVAPSCSSCALGLAGFFGLSSLFAFLPFKGAEMGIVAIVLLVFSLGYLSKKIMAEQCSLE